MNQQVDLIEKYAVRGIFGGKGSGKTTFILGDVSKAIKGLAEKYVREYGMRKVFIDTIKYRPEPPDYLKIPIIPWRHIHRLKRGGAARIIVGIEESVECFQHILDKGMDETMFTVEDSAKTIPQNIERHPIRSLCIDSKNKHNSINFMYHMWTDLPPRLKGIIDYYVVFKTSADTPEDRGIKNRDVLTAYENVMRNEKQWYHELVKNSA